MKNPFIDADIFLSGFIGDEGTKKLVEKYPEKLSGRFSKSYLRSVLCWSSEEASVELKTGTAVGDRPAPHPGSTEEKMMFLQESIEELQQNGFLKIPLNETGLLGGLWKLAEKTRCGFLVDLKEAPIHQETVEVSEWLKLNPYEIDSKGAAIIIIPKNTEELFQGLSFSNTAGESVPEGNLSRIGSLHKEKGKWILRGDTKQCLNRPKKKGIEC